MTKFSDLITKKRTTKIEIIKVIKEEFLNRRYKPLRESATAFSKELEKEHPGINRWAASCDTVSHRDIEDIIMDEFRIP